MSIHSFYTHYCHVSLEPIGFRWNDGMQLYVGSVSYICCFLRLCIIPNEFLKIGGGIMDFNCRCLLHSGYFIRWKATSISRVKRHTFYLIIDIFQVYCLGWQYLVFKYNRINFDRQSDKEDYIIVSSCSLGFI